MTPHIIFLLDMGGRSRFFFATHWFFQIRNLIGNHLIMIRKVCPAYIDQVMVTLVHPGYCTKLCIKVFHQNIFVSVSNKPKGGCVSSVDHSPFHLESIVTIWPRTTFVNGNLVLVDVYWLESWVKKQLRGNHIHRRLLLALWRRSIDLFKTISESMTLDRAFFHHLGAFSTTVPSPPRR